MADKNGAGKNESGGRAAIGATAIKPDTKEGFAGFLEFLYNKKTGEVLGRSAKSWAQITLFYIVYYSCLAAFWAAMMAAFLNISIKDDAPRWTLDDSLIGSRPGLGIKPSQHSDSLDSTIIYLDTTTYEAPTNCDDAGLKSNKGYHCSIQKFLETNFNESTGTDCSGEQDAKNAFRGKTWCRPDIGGLGECGGAPYGYQPQGNTVSPCVFIKLNKIYNASPKGIKQVEDNLESDEALISDIMTKDVTRYNSIESNIEKAGDYPAFIDCQGEYPADREALAKGGMKYFPENKAYDAYSFPMYTTKGSPSPVVAVKFNNLPVGQLVHVICHTYYSGVVHNKKNKQGFVQFQLFVNPK